MYSVFIVDVDILNPRKTGHLALIQTADDTYVANQ